MATTSIDRSAGPSAALSRRGALVAALVAALLTGHAAPLTAAGPEVAEAAMRGDLAAVRALVLRKVDVNTPQGDGATALHWAVYRGRIDILDTLLKAGANPK